jgi:hypothetical protein
MPQMNVLFTEFHELFWLACLTTPPFIVNGDKVEVKTFIF